MSNSRFVGDYTNEEKFDKVFNVQQEDEDAKTVKTI